MRQHGRGRIRPAARLGRDSACAVASTAAAAPAAARPLAGVSAGRCRLGTRARLADRPAPGEWQGGGPGLAVARRLPAGVAAGVLTRG